MITHFQDLSNPHFQDIDAQRFSQFIVPKVSKSPFVYPPTPAAAGKARQRRNYQQHMFVQKVTSNTCSFRKQRWSLGSASPPLDRSKPVQSLRVLEGQGVWLLRGGPLNRAVQDENQMQDDGSKVEARSAGRQAK